MKMHPLTLILNKVLLILLSYPLKKEVEWSWVYGSVLDLGDHSSVSALPEIPV